MPELQPTIFHFNPTCEIAIANGSPHFVPSALLRQFESDLSTIMMLFAESNDIVAYSRPNNEWLERMQNAGFVLPHFKTMDELRTDLEDSSISGVRLESWGKSPAESQLFRFLVNDKLAWKDAYRVIFERKTAADFLRRLFQSGNLPDYIDAAISPQIVKTEAEIESLLKAVCPLVLKAPLSSSGRGLTVLRRHQLNESNRQWIGGVLEQQGYLIAEPWLNKKLDFSLQYLIDDNHRVQYLGPSFFLTNTNGQYSGHILNFKDFSLIPGGKESLTAIAGQIQSELENSPYCNGYCGPLGVDMISYTDSGNKLKIHPCIEINPRYTMGYLSKKLELKVHPEASGFFKIHFDPKGNMLQFIQKKRENNPVILVDGLVKKGFLELTPVDSSTKFCAYLELL